MNAELERFDPAEQRGRIVYEHLHRYALCRDYVEGRRVLDLACGTGYGTAILGTAAAQVTGVDISSSAIRAARKRYASDNTKFLIGDCFDLPFDSGSFDIVIANQMIERVEDHEGLLAEVRRVLSPNGLLLISTPNKPVYNRHNSPNALNVSEMEVAEFRKLLTGEFKHVRLTGMRMALLSVGFALDTKHEHGADNLAAARIHLATGSSAGKPNVEPGEMNLADPEYVLAVCSDAPLEDVPFPSSVFFDEKNDLWVEHERLIARTSVLGGREAVLRADLERTRELLDQERERAAKLEATCAEKDERLLEFREAQTELRTSLERQRETHARETEAAERAVGERLQTLATILEKLGCAGVERSDQGIVASLFEVNQTLVTERLKRLQAERAHGDLVSRFSAIQGEAEHFKATRQEYEAQLAKRQRDWESEKRLRSDVEAERDKLEEELRGMSDRLKGEIAARDLALEKERKLNASLRQELEQLEKARAKAEIKAEAPPTPQAPYSADREPEPPLQSDSPRPAEAETALSADSNRRSVVAGSWQADHALYALHSRTAALVGSAPAKVIGKIAPPPKRPPLPFHRRILGKTRPFATNIFLADWLARQAPNLGDMSLRSYVERADCRALSPHPLFDAAYYLETYPDVAESGMSPLVHYVLHGWREGRDPHPLFANDWYLAQYPDVAAWGEMSALDHYLMHGWREGRQPNPLFNPRTYLDRYPDVEEAEFEPLSHFIAHGEAEGRELSLEGWGQHLPDLARQGGALQVMRRLLRERPVAPMSAPLADAEIAPRDVEFWGPPPVDDFWPTNTMREMIAAIHGEPLLSRIWYLLSLMNRWQDRQAEFVTSDDCRSLLERLRERANATVKSADWVPEASIIVPVYNNVLDTLLCLASVLELDERYDFEIIVADDGSTDATPALVGSIGGVVRHLRQPSNFGFVGNCNAAAAEARGRNIVLLNNDTLVFTGWLNGLIDPIKALSGVGLVGSKLINWDGTLQEAGGIFWRDGSAWNFGRNQDVLAPEFNYLKDVDYCSGASIVVPAHIWREVGGFDPSYSPAYCEDSDLAFRLRKAGYRTLYSPASEVVHHEGRSHGRDVESGMKAWQVTNSEKLLKRWQTVLEREHRPSGTDVLQARDRSFGKRHVLVIDHYVPQWDKDAGSRTMLAFLQTLIEADHSVTFWPDNLWRDPDYTPGLQAMGVEVIYGPRYRGAFDKFLTDRQGLYDMVLLSRPHIAINYIETIKRHSNARVVYYGHDIHFRRMLTERQVAGLPPADEKVLEMQAQELAICNQSDVVLYPSVEEARVIRDLTRPGLDVRAVPAYRYNSAALDEARQRVNERPDGGERLHLLFVGGFGHPPNTDAVTWFCRSVMPLLRERAPAGVHLTIAGSKPGAEVVALQAQDVDVLGFVGDRRLHELYADADMAVAPLRFGAGVKGKVIEAMALGVPVVTTSVGAQGIEGAADMLFLGETPEELVEQILRAAERATARRYASAALDYIERNYSSEAMRETLELGLAPT